MQAFDDVFGGQVIPEIELHPVGEGLGHGHEPLGVKAVRKLQGAADDDYFAGIGMKFQSLADNSLIIGIGTDSGIFCRHRRCLVGTDGGTGDDGGLAEQVVTMVESILQCLVSHGNHQVKGSFLQFVDQHGIDHAGNLESPLMALHIEIFHIHVNPAGRIRQYILNSLHDLVGTGEPGVEGVKHQDVIGSPCFIVGICCGRARNSKHCG